MPRCQPADDESPARKTAQPQKGHIARAAKAVTPAGSPAAAHAAGREVHEHPSSGVRERLLPTTRKDLGGRSRCPLAIAQTN